MPSDLVMRGLLSIDMDMAKHEAECTARDCPLTVAVEVVRMLDRRDLNGADIAGVLHVVAVEYLLRLAGPAQRKAFALEVVDNATRLMTLANAEYGQHEPLKHTNRKES